MHCPQKVRHSLVIVSLALESGDVSKVVPIDKLSVAIAIGLSMIILKEPAEIKTILGGLLIIGGTLVIIW